MSVAVEYQKQMMEIVYVNLPGPEEPTPGMSGGELLHGFLADLHTTANPDIKAYADALCLKWNVHYKQG